MTSLPPSVYISDQDGSIYGNKCFVNTLTAIGNTQQAGVAGNPVITTPSLAAGNLFSMGYVANGVVAFTQLYPVVQDAAGRARVGSDLNVIGNVTAAGYNNLPQYVLPSNLSVNSLTSNLVTSLVSNASYVNAPAANIANLTTQNILGWSPNLQSIQGNSAAYTYANLKNLTYGNASGNSLTISNINCTFANVGTLFVGNLQGYLPPVANLSNVTFLAAQAANVSNLFSNVANIPVLYTSNIVGNLNPSFGFANISNLTANSVSTNLMSYQTGNGVNLTVSGNVYANNLSYVSGNGSNLTLSGNVSANAANVNRLATNVLSYQTGNGVSLSLSGNLAANTAQVSVLYCSNIQGFSAIPSNLAVQSVSANTASITGALTVGNVTVCNSGSFNSALGNAYPTQALYGFYLGGYQHALRTRHYANAAANNAIDFYCWTPSDNVASYANTLALSVTATGLGVGNVPYPAYNLDVAGNARVQGALFCSNIVGMNAVQYVLPSNVAFTVANATQLNAVSANVQNLTVSNNLSFQAANGSSISATSANLTNLYVSNLTGWAPSAANLSVLPSVSYISAQSGNVTTLFSNAANALSLTAQTATIGSITCSNIVGYAPPSYQLPANVSFTNANVTGTLYASNIQGINVAQYVLPSFIQASNVFSNSATHNVLYCSNIQGYTPPATVIPSNPTFNTVTLANAATFNNGLQSNWIGNAYALQQQFNYGGGNGIFAHALRTRHNGNAVANNAIDLYTWTPSSDGPAGIANTLALSVTSAGLGVGSNPNPQATLDVSGTTRLQGTVAVQRNIAVYANSTPQGDWMTSTYAGLSDRYGVGLYNNGGMRMFCSQQYTNSYIGLSLASPDTTGATATFNDLFIAANSAVYTNRELSLNYNPLTIRGANDKNHMLSYNGTVNGVVLQGYQGGQLYTTIANSVSLSWGSQTVGINTAAPASAFNLDVNGSGRFSSTLQMGSNINLSNNVISFRNDQYHGIGYNSTVNGPTLSGYAGGQLLTTGGGGGVNLAWNTTGVGINNSNPGYSLDVSGTTRLNGTLLSGATSRATYPLSLAASANAATQICTVSDSGGGCTYSINLHLVQSQNYNSILKSYKITSVWGALTTFNTWQRVMPDVSTGSSNNNDFALDVYQTQASNNGAMAIRVTRTGVGSNTSTALTAYVEVVGDSGSSPATLTYSGTTSTGATFSGQYPYNLLGTITGNVGVNTLTPAAAFDVNGPAKLGNLSLYGSATSQIGYMMRGSELIPAVPLSYLNSVGGYQWNFNFPSALPDNKYTITATVASRNSYTDWYTCSVTGKTTTGATFNIARLTGLNTSGNNVANVAVTTWGDNALNVDWIVMR